MLCCAVSADLGVVDPVQLVAMHKAKADAETADSASSNGSNGAAAGSSAASNGAATGSSRSDSSDSTSDADARTMSAGSVAGFEAGQVDSLGQYDPESDRFVGGAAGAGKNGHKATEEEQLRIDMTQKKGAEWGLLQLDLSFAWSMEDKPVDDVEQLLREAAVQVSASTR